MTKDQVYDVENTLAKILVQIEAVPDDEPFTVSFHAVTKEEAIQALQHALDQVQLELLEPAESFDDE
jgi:hypothetical protein